MATPSMSANTATELLSPTTRLALAVCFLHSYGDSGINPFAPGTYDYISLNGVTNHGTAIAMKQ